MEFLSRAELLAHNGYFARFCRDWQERHYHPSLSAFRPGEMVHIDGKSYKIRQKECDRRNAALEEDYAALLDEADPIYLLQPNLIERSLHVDGSGADDRFSALCHGLHAMMETLGWKQLLLISLHAPSPFLASSQGDGPFVAARQRLEAEGMPSNFKGGILMDRDEVSDHLPQLLVGVAAQAVPLAFAPAKDQAIFGTFSDQGMIYSYFSTMTEQTAFERAARSANLVPGAA